MVIKIVMLNINENSMIEKIGNRIGFFSALMVFSSILYFIGAKLSILPSGIYYETILVVVVIHIIYSVVRGL